MSWDGPSGLIELRAPHGTPSPPPPSQSPFITLDCVGLCRPSLPATHGPGSNPQSSPESCRPACRACTTSPPVEMLKSSLLPLELAPDVVVTGALLGWSSGCWATWASGGTEQGVPGSCAFQPSFTQTCFDLGKTLDLWAQPLKWGSGLHANSVL